MRRSFPLHDLSTDEFETLVGAVCHHILGTGAIVFASGPDGGRDARFIGTASNFPSDKSPLSGRIIIQAKHTSNPVASISDSEFTKVVSGEVPRITELIKTNELEHYLLFTNRKAPAGCLTAHEGKLKSICPGEAYILGIEQIRMFLTLHPNVWLNLGFGRFESKLQIQPDDLTAVIQGFHSALNAPDAEASQNFSYVEKPKKNKVNKLSEDYYRQILEHSLPYFSQIEKFLKNPRNEELRNLYEDTADEIRRKLIVGGCHFSTFDDALTHIIDVVTTNNIALKGRRRFAGVFLHYMYYNCDVGQHADTV